MQPLQKLNYKKSSINNISAFLSFYRAKEWLHILGLILLGYAYSGYYGSLSKLALALLIGCLYLAHGYSINDIYDDQLKIDIPRTFAFFLSFLALFLCLALGSLISASTLLILVAGHLAGFLYSAQPARLKNKLWLDLIFNSLALSPLFLLGSAINSEPSKNTWATFWLIFIYFLPIQLLHQMQDKDIDVASRQKNTFQILGAKKTKKLISITLILYICANLLLWKIKTLSFFSAFCGIIFSLALSLYMSVVDNSARKKITINRNIKFDARHISIAYGIMLLISFWLKH